MDDAFWIKLAHIDTHALLLFVLSYLVKSKRWADGLYIAGWITIVFSTLAGIFGVSVDLF